MRKRCFLTLLISVEGLAKARSARDRRMSARHARKCSLDPAHAWQRDLTGLHNVLPLSAHLPNHLVYGILISHII